MRKLILMTSAAIIAPLSGLAENITCTATPNCADLGYTESSCPDNKGVKCPWGEAWFCPPSPPEVCEIGSILYSDMTCYKDAQAGKTPIGVVIYVDGLGGGQALALASIGNYAWGQGMWGQSMHVSGLTNYVTAPMASTDLDSCGNTAKIIAAGDKSKYPAAWAAHEYSTEGTSAGDWCLPAAGIFTLYYNNQEAVNTGFSRANGTKFSNTSPYTEAWSSSEGFLRYAWHSYFSNSYYGLSDDSNYRSHEVRPVFEFVQTFEGVCKASQQYACTGVGYEGGIGESCGGKYTECTCASGYVWIGSDCKRICEVGSELGYILYSDMTRSAELDSTKTPIGVVVCSYLDGGGQAMALKSLDTKYKWSLEDVDISGLTNLSASAALTDYASCENSKIIMATGDKSKYPAVWAANEYSTEGTSAGDWCLPAAGIFTSYYNNQEAVNTGFDRANGTQFTTSTHAWSSSEAGRNDAWYLDFNYGLLWIQKYNSSLEIRPVIEF